MTKIIANKSTALSFNNEPQTILKNMIEEYSFGSYASRKVRVWFLPKKNPDLL